jgi:hypothetical protein
MLLLELLLLLGAHLEDLCQGGTTTRPRVMLPDFGATGVPATGLTEPLSAFSAARSSPSELRRFLWRRRGTGTGNSTLLSGAAVEDNDVSDADADEVDTSTATAETTTEVVDD